MIAFTQNEILRSMFNATILGICMCFFSTLINILGQLFPTIGTMLIGSFKYEKIFSIEKYDKTNKCTHSPLYIFLCTIAFAISFMLLSYYSLDGQIRLYMLLQLFASFYISKITFFVFLEQIVSKLFMLLASIITIILRVIFLPFITISRKILRKKQNLVHAY